MQDIPRASIPYLRNSGSFRQDTKVLSSPPLLLIRPSVKIPPVLQVLRMQLTKYLCEQAYTSWMLNCRAPSSNDPQP